MRSLRCSSIACLLLLGLLAVPAVGWAANATVDATPSLTFNPPNVTIQVGETVTWRNQGGLHNVVSNGNFRCANGCDDQQGGDGNLASNAWSATRTFNQAGTFTFYCELHGSPNSGMKGTVTVEAAAPDPQPGTLRFTQATYSVNEAGGSVNILVSRSNGEDGAVSAAFAATAGTATAGQDFTATSGTLNWADGDASNKSFSVAIANDAANEANETVQLTLSNPTGGAVLDATRKTAILTIVDNDAPSGGGTPNAPSNLRVTSTGIGEVQLAWNDNSNNETEFRIERKPLGGAYADAGATDASATSFAVSGLDPGKLYTFRVRAAGSGGTFSPYSNEVSAAPDVTPAPCVADATTLCINGGRFKVQVDWRTPVPSSGAGQAVPIPSAPDSGLFYFFSPSNLEMLIKVLNACGLTPSRYWVFYAATTNVELTTTVTDTQSGKVKVYFNPLNTPAPPVQDTDAFATCP